jgi:glycosyltransferase involved in cell wall biosynthesis
LLHHNMPTLAAAAPPPMPVVAVTHGCVSTWWQAAKPGQPLAPEYRWHRQLMSEGLRAADRLIAPTASYARMVARHYGLPRTPFVVHNGRTPLVSRSCDGPADRVLTVGRLWDRVKRTELLDRVASQLVVPFDAAGALIGPHGERTEIEGLHPLGELDGGQLGEHLAARPIFVSAASFEPFGLAVLEAAAAGCALVLSDIPSFRELWDGAALFVHGDDEEDYVGAIETLLSDASERGRLGAAAKERAARYTPEAMADAMLAIYAELIGTRAFRKEVAA